MDSHASTLFDQQAPLQLEITANFKQLTAIDQETEAEYGPGQLVVLENGTQIHNLSVELKARGKSRLNKDNCKFPLFFIRFSAEAQGTIFQDQDVLPLTTHCQKKRSYQAYIHKEYLIYQMYGLLTDKSLHSRLVNIRYVDSGRGNRETESYGIFIEHFAKAAERLNGEIVPATRSNRLTEPSQTALVEVFHYMVGNTDWSVAFGHNVLMLKIDEDIVPIPYDFDQSGAIDTEYAVPSDKLRIRRVTQRIFRGICKPPQTFQDAIGSIKAQRSSFTQLISQHQPLDDRPKQKMLRYLDGFFDIVQEPEVTEKRIINECR
ncbi:MAG: hypothetical protein AAF438_04730 [Pseudomonadota bacterium]